MPAAHVRRLKEALPGTDIYIMYGQTEATARLSYLDPAMLHEKAGSVGKAIPGVDLRVVDGRGVQVRPGEMGEIIARGENVMLGYWKDPEETAKVLRDGWLHTGDLATVDEDGFIFIAGRKGEMIKSGAHRISPKEIEEVIASIPGVAEVAVAGRSDEILGERIAAFIVPREEGAIETREVLLYCRQNLPSYKIPHDIIFVRELPKTGSGKVRKFLLGKQESAFCAG